MRSPSLRTYSGGDAACAFDAGQLAAALAQRIEEQLPRIAAVMIRGARIAQREV